MTTTEAAPAQLAMAQAVNPNMPAPITTTFSPETRPAWRRTAATVEVAQLAQAATSSGMLSGTRKMAVPEGRWQCSAKAPLKGWWEASCW